MILCINGSRLCVDYAFLEKALEHYDITPIKVDEVVSGAAKGADKLGEVWAKKNKIPVTQFKADWNNLDAPNAVIKDGPYGQYNASAGFERNQEMADYADALVCLQPDGDTSGSQDCVSKFLKLNKPVYIYPPPKKKKVYEF